MLYFKILLCLVIISGCSPKSEDVIVIGSKMDTEGTILGYIQLLALEDAGLKVEDRIETGPTLIVRQALLSGEIDGYIEYTGTALVNFMKLDNKEVLSDAVKAYRTIAQWDSMLEGYGLLSSVYLQIVNMDAGLIYQTLNQGSVDAAIGYSTDGRIAAFNLVRLEDIRNFFPVYNPTPIYREETLRRFPKIEKILNRIASTISAEDITELNYRNDVNLERPKLLAREWLVKKNLLGGKD
jgi:osmoprotectant transport system substrate-binding protein